MKTTKLQLCIAESCSKIQAQKVHNYYCLTSLICRLYVHKLPYKSIKKYGFSKSLIRIHSATFSSVFINYLELKQSLRNNLCKVYRPLGNYCMINNNVLHFFINENYIGKPFFPEKVLIKINNAFCDIICTKLYYFS